MVDSFDSGAGLPSTLAYVDFTNMFADISNIFQNNRVLDMERARQVTANASARLDDKERSLAIREVRDRMSKQEQLRNYIITDANQQVAVASEGFDSALESGKYGDAIIIAGEIIPRFSPGYSGLQLISQQYDNSEEMNVTGNVNQNGADKANMHNQKMQASYWIASQSQHVRAGVGAMQSALSKKIIHADEVFGENLDALITSGFVTEEEVPVGEVDRDDVTLRTPSGTTTRVVPDKKKQFSIMELLDMAKDGNDAASQAARDYLLNHTNGAQRNAMAGIMGGIMITDPVIFNGSKYETRFFKVGSSEHEKYMATRTKLANVMNRKNISDPYVAMEMLREEEKDFAEWNKLRGSGLGFEDYQSEMRTKNVLSDTSLLYNYHVQSGLTPGADTFLNSSIVATLGANMRNIPGYSTYQASRDAMNQTIDLYDGKGSLNLHKKYSDAAVELASVLERLESIENERPDLVMSGFAAATVAEVGTVARSSLGEVSAALDQMDDPNAPEYKLLVDKEESLAALEMIVNYGRSQAGRKKESELFVPRDSFGYFERLYPHNVITDGTPVSLNGKIYYAKTEKIEHAAKAVSAMYVMNDETVSRAVRDKAKIAFRVNLEKLGLADDEIIKPGITPNAHSLRNLRDHADDLQRQINMYGKLISESSATVTVAGEEIPKGANINVSLSPLTESQMQAKREGLAAEIEVARIRAKARSLGSSIGTAGANLPKTRAEARDGIITANDADPEGADWNGKAWSDLTDSEKVIAADELIAEQGLTFEGE